MNPTVGDYSANAQKIMEWIDRAELQRADLIVFPEMSLCGYPVWDLANKQRFVSQGLEHLKRITAFTGSKKVTAVVGYIEPGENSEGRNRNAMAWIMNGTIIFKYIKRLLPTYDVFLEDIFFEPGLKSKVLKWNNIKIGNTICEDIWDARYPQKPVRDLARQGMQLGVNISASPYYAGVAQTRESLVKRHVKSSRAPMLYVNQVGAQDDLIFDGRSFLTDAAGRVLFQAPAFKEGLFFYDLCLGKKQSSIPAVKSSPVSEVYEALVSGVRDYCKKNRFQKVVMGLSGGIDSALVATIACDALGADAVLGVTMPGTYSSKGSWTDAKKLADALGIKCRMYPIGKKYEFLVAHYHQQKKRLNLPFPQKGQISLAMENLQARIRGLELMYISNDEGRLLLTTGNKSELAMGYCTLYGDMAGGLSVIGDVFKTDVYALAKYRNSISPVIPKASISKAPSAELRPNQKDQDSLPPYSVLDEILRLYIEKNQSREAIIKRLARKRISPATVIEVIRKVDHNEYKRRQTPPILRVSEKAWFGRRMPITNRFEA